jgi:antitoxin CptB
VTALDENPIDEHDLGKLRWRCRRGLLENDLFLERFFKRHGATLLTRQASALTALMELSDHDLLDLHLARKTLAEVSPSLDSEHVREVLTMLRENR